MASAALSFNEWTEPFGSERLTGALLDRLTHHVHILEMKGESYRPRDSKQKRTGKATVNFSNAGAKDLCQGK